jgi:acetyl esterase/lipase
MQDLVATLFEEQAKQTEIPPIDEWREGYEEFGRMFPGEPGVEPQPVDAGGVKAAWFAAPGVDDRRVVVYFHGGGYLMGSLTTHLSITSRLTGAAGARLLALDYRLTPDHRFPAPIDDIVASYRWLLDQGVAPGSIAFAGDSAGGGMCVAGLLALRQAGLPMPCCAVPISPWVDLVGEGAWRDTDPAVDPVVGPAELDRFVREYVTPDQVRDPLVSPLFGDLAGLPPLLIQVGTREVLLSDATRLAEKAGQAGVDVSLEIEDGACHVWHHAAPVVPEAAAAIERAGAFMAGHFKAG